MIERAVRLPTDHALIGVVTESGPAPPARPSFVFLNAGMLHRIGPNRVYVRLARSLARHGVTSLRFDLSGVGDSAPRRDAATFRAAAARDVADAMDYLSETHGARGGFVLAGVCSGADLAFRVALSDPRVVGLVLLDGLPYRTRRAVAHQWLRRAGRPGAWRNVVTPARALRVVRGIRASAQTTVAPAGLGRRDVPARREAEHGLRMLTERGVRILAIYTEGREYAYRRQFAHTFPSVRGDRVRVAYLEGADHTLTLLANQDRLVQTVEDWIAAWPSS